MQITVFWAMKPHILVETLLYFHLLNEHQKDALLSLNLFQ